MGCAISANKITMTATTEPPSLDPTNSSSDEAETAIIAVNEEGDIDVITTIPVRPVTKMKIDSDRHDLSYSGDSVNSGNSGKSGSSSSNTIPASPITNNKNNTNSNSNSIATSTATTVTASNVNANVNVSKKNTQLMISTDSTAMTAVDSASSFPAAFRQSPLVSDELIFRGGGRLLATPRLNETGNSQVRTIFYKTKILDAREDFDGRSASGPGSGTGSGTGPGPVEKIAGPPPPVTPPQTKPSNTTRSPRSPNNSLRLPLTPSPTTLHLSPNLNPGATAEHLHDMLTSSFTEGERHDYDQKRGEIKRRGFSIIKHSSERNYDRAVAESVKHRRKTASLSQISTFRGPNISSGSGGGQNRPPQSRMSEELEHARRHSHHVIYE